MSTSISVEIVQACAGYEPLLSNPQDIKRALINAGPAAQLYEAIVELTEMAAATAEARGHAPCVCRLMTSMRERVIPNPRNGVPKCVKTFRRWARTLESLGLIRRIVRDFEDGPSEFESWDEHARRHGRDFGLVLGDLATRLRAHREERASARGGESNERTER